jgi:protein-S-isoprenylcysteine O-methyltransferase Ste14
MTGDPTGIPADRRWLASWLATGLVVGQIIHLIVLDGGRIAWLRYAGFALWTVAVVFGILPIFQFKRQGGVAHGDSYIETTRLVDTGLYSIVRHPQFVAWPLTAAAVALVSQHPVVATMGGAAILLAAVDYRAVDALDVAKFGDDYRRYQERVPGWNFAAGAWRRLRRRVIAPAEPDPQGHRLPSSHMSLPAMYLVRQEFARPRVTDVAEAVRSQLRRPEILATLAGKRRVAVAVGSRGIAGLQALVGALITGLREAGVDPFIVPSMGSHGGATAEGQVQVLAHLGITESSVDAPIRSSMEVVEVGEVVSPSGAAVPVFMDAVARTEADCVVPVNRIKPHTGFRGPVESGLCKMLTIGLGKHEGARTLHRRGYGAFDPLILEAGCAVLATGHVAFGLATVENAYEEPALVEAIPASGIVEREKALLEEARRLMPSLPLPTIDVLVVERFGKNISGVGMDPNVTGRGEDGLPLPGYAGPDISRVVVLDLTPETEGNANGIGLADLTTERLLEAMDRTVTWTNTLTAGSLACGRIPIALPTDEEAIGTALATVPGVDPKEASLVRIKDTLHLSEFAVSESLTGQLEGAANCRVVGRWDGTWTG